MYLGTWTHNFIEQFTTRDELQYDIYLRTACYDLTGRFKFIFVPNNT